MAMSFAVPVSAPSGSPFARSVGFTAAFRSASVIGNPLACGSAEAADAAGGGASDAGVCARPVAAGTRHNTVASTSTIFFVMGLLTLFEVDTVSLSLVGSHRFQIQRF